MGKILKIVKTKKFIAGAVIAVIIFIAISRFIGGNKQKYPLATVKKDNITQLVSASGKLKSENQIDLKFQSSGLLSWVGVKEGDSVKKWQGIASLDKRQLQNDIKKRLLAYMNQRWTFEQTQDDYEAKKNSSILTDAEKRILEMAQFNLDSSVIDVETYDLAKQLATITSPINGIVTNLVYTVPGQNVFAGSVVATVVSPDKMVFEANIDEGDIAKIFMSQKAEITVDAYPDEVFNGEVTKISFAATTTSGGGTAFPVEISIPPNENFKFKIGMNGDAELIAKEANDILIIPSMAVFQTDGKSYVWKVVNKTLTKQEIDQILEEATNKIKGGEKI